MAGEPTLKHGAKGNAVKRLQRALARAGYQVEADGDFGPATDRAVRAFQAARGLAADGIAGPATWAAVGGGGAARNGGGGKGNSRLSQKGAAFIAHFEGLKLKLYNDPVGHATIGVGHLVHRGPGAIVVTGGGRLSITAQMGAGGVPDREVAMVHTFGGTRDDLVRALALAEAGRVRTHVEVSELEAAGRVLSDLDAGNVLGRAVLVP
jgi:hypothetical protein